MARASTRLLERLAVQAQQPRVPAPAPMPRASEPQQSRPSGAPARPAPAAGQGSSPGRATSHAAGNGKLTLGAAVPPDVAERIAAVRAAATPVTAPKVKPKPEPAARSESTPTKPKHDRPHPIERLATTFPTVFDIHAPVPLAIGIHNEIIAATGDAMPHNRIGAVLGRWTDRVNYLSSVAAPGSRRVHLDGSDAGEVTDEHRAVAAAKLAEKMATTALAAGSHNSPHATGKDRDMARISATARKMKVTTVLDVAAFADMPPISDNAPSRTALTVNVAGRKFTADIATKSVRRALAVIAEHGAEGVVVLIQGTLGAGDEITEAGLTAQPKAPAKAAAA